ncbi:MAG TPA: substrate-binding domain-containing protein [Bryobacteraceae bacterium]|nr:substrate-binding domain-containing protein [Bryobacteraceae bacterium]
MTTSAIRVPAAQAGGVAVGKGYERALLALLAVEIAIFSFTGTNFWSITNAFELVRLGAELGVLALALTPIILSGGIDLSVGSAMGLCAVALGALWRDHGLPLPVAIAIVLCIGALGGMLNGLLIARFNIAPLIVTLGTYSLFRGVAEGWTKGAVNYSGFPPGFLYLGQGYVFTVVPVQAFILLSAALFYWTLVHRSVIGRSLSAIGFAPDGALYAGIPVARRLLLVYTLSGLSASVAAVIYVAHLGQAKADAGTGYELIAITAVVMGGTSIFGGRATVTGSLLGLAAMVVLQNGLRLSAMPAELAGVLTGVLLIAAVLLEHARSNSSQPRRRLPRLALAAAVALLLLMAAFGAREIAPHAGSPTSVTIGMMPKAKGDPYFVSCRKGAEEAARELGLNLIWDGPTELDAAKQNEVVEAWITKHVDAIAVAVENRAGISTVLRKAMSRGIPVLTWDADADPDAREFFVNQATPQGIGYTLVDRAALLLGGSGDFAIITGALTAANQNEWIRYIRERLRTAHPRLNLVTIEPCDDDRDKAFAKTQTILKVYPNVKLIMGIAAPAVPGAAEAVKQSGRSDVKVMGLSLPSLCKAYVHEGVVQAVVLWNTHDLGYLTVYAANAAARGKLKPSDARFAAGRLGKVQIRDGQILLGAPFVFDGANIDRFDF